jgi:hypothetical protein
MSDGEDGVSESVPGQKSASKAGLHCAQFYPPPKRITGDARQSSRYSPHAQLIVVSARCPTRDRTVVASNRLSLCRSERIVGIGDAFAIERQRGSFRVRIGRRAIQAAHLV